VIEVGNSRLQLAAEWISTEIQGETKCEGPGEIPGLLLLIRRLSFRAQAAAAAIALFSRSDDRYIMGARPPMNIAYPRSMDAAAFLSWTEGREGRYELARGRVMMMTGGSRAHALIVRRVANALERRLDAARWTILTSDFAVKVGPDTVRYPDVVADVGDGALNDLAATAPGLIAEVLSPSSVTNDLGDKAGEYLHLASVSAYIVLSQDEPKAWLWVRGQSGFPGGPEVIMAEGVIRIPVLSIELPLAEVYRGFAPDQAKS
jgi:Uma2 family endonuclease